MADFRSALASGRTLLLDGGMGTMLQARGLPAGEHPEQFCLDRPDVLRGIHADYLAAGADIILTCTFGGSRLKLPAGIDVTPFNRTMARIARAAVDAAGREAFVAGDMGPCGQFVRPLGDLHPLELYEALREQARGLVEGGVDLFLIETQFDLAEVRIAVAAIRAESDLPIMVSMTFEQGTSLTGTTPEIFAETMQNLGVDALGLNCGLGPEQMAPLMERFLACSSVPVLAEPNAALPFCPGSPLVNSISGEADRMEHLGPLCRQWGAPFILLPIQGRKLPVKAADRIAIIENMLDKAAMLGIPRRLVLVDVLALAVASKAEAAREGLETIRWCAAHGLATTIGLSNISFGLPARELVNTTFLSMAMGAGLSSCIANPSSGRLREAKAAGDVLMGHDRDAAAFVNGYAMWTPGNGGTADAAAFARATAQTVEEAVILGDRESVVGLVEKELEAGADPFELVRGRLIPAITEVGSKYERREYFLPQLLRSAETMQTAFARLKPLLEREANAEAQKIIVVATVEGDIHDIGKNIVSLMLGNHGFKVVDLGKDVKAEAIVEAAVAHKADLIGLSALMTTTMVRMRDTVDLVKQRGLGVDVMVVGAVVTPAFAESIGANYSSDAVDAVRLAKSLIAARKNQ